MERTYSPVHKDIDPNLPVQKCLANILPLELLRLRNALPTLLALVLEAVHHECALLLRQEVRRLGEVVQQPKARDGDQDGDYALKNENPPPALQVPDAVHLADAKSQQAGKGAGHGRRGEEHGLTELDLVAAVPHR